MYRPKMQIENRERRIIIVGKTGNGKSSTGNSILRKSAFKHETSPNAVTECCTMKTGTDASNGKLYKIIDTPGLLDTSKCVSELALDILESIQMLAKPNVFLIVFSVKNRMTEDERFTIDILRIMFGEKVFDHAIVVFTHGDELNLDEDFKKFWTKNKHFVQLIEKCGNRVVRIENSNKFFDFNNGREDIVNMIEELTDSGNKYYNYEHLDTHRSVLVEHLQKYEGKGSIHEEVSEIVKMLDEKLDKGIWKKMLFGGIIIGGGAMGLGYVAGAAAGANAIAATGFGAAVIRTAGSVATAAASSNVGSALINNGANVGGAVVRAALNVATKIRFW